MILNGRVRPNTLSRRVISSPTFQPNFSIVRAPTKAPLRVDLNVSSNAGSQL